MSKQPATPKPTGLQVETVPVESITRNPDNYRAHPPAKRQAVVACFTCCHRSPERDSDACQTCTVDGRMTYSEWAEAGDTAGLPTPVEPYQAPTEIAAAIAHLRWARENIAEAETHLRDYSKPQGAQSG